MVETIETEITIVKFEITTVLIGLFNRCNNGYFDNEKLVIFITL